VIVPALGALPETIVSPEQARDGLTGWLVPVGDVAALAARLREALLLDPSARARIGARARAAVLAKFSLGRMQAATLSVYDELLGTDLAARFAANAG
jgi:glycosyltransferase involved in cell wall biosynthesis